MAECRLGRYAIMLAEAQKNPGKVICVCNNQHFVFDNASDVFCAYFKGELPHDRFMVYGMHTGESNIGNLTPFLK